MHSARTLTLACIIFELLPFEHCSYQFLLSNLKTGQNVLMTCWLSGERLLPFGLIVIYATGQIRICKIRFVHTGDNRRKPCLVCKKRWVFTQWNQTQI